MSKLTFVFTIFLVLPFSAYSQYCNPNAYEDEFQSFLNSRTFFVLTNDDEYNKIIKDAAADYWTHTPYDFINGQEFLEKREDNRYSFVFPGTVTISWGMAYGNYLKLTVLQGGENTTPITYTGYDMYGDEEEFSAGNYRLKHMVSSLVQSIQLRIDDNINLTDSRIVTSCENQYNKNNHKLKNKTLLIEKGDIEEAGAHKLEKYSSNFKVVSKNDIKKAIDNKDEKYCYLMPVRNTNKDVMVFDAATGEILYIKNDLRGKKVKAKDIKRVIKEM